MLYVMTTQGEDTIIINATNIADALQKALAHHDTQQGGEFAGIASSTDAYVGFEWTDSIGNTSVYEIVLADVIGGEA
jgi:hypothetical protein